MAKEWTDKDYAQAAIDMLPGTVEEIAEFLRVHEIVGSRWSAHRCPIAQWVQKWTGDSEWVTPGRVVSDSVIEDDWEWEIENPPAVQGFIRRYDAGLITL
jgi:hypothetical protein